MAGKWMVTQARQMTPNLEAVTLHYHTESGDYNATVDYSYARVKPMDEDFMSGESQERALITMFQEGSPSITPYSGTKIVDADSRHWLIEHVRSKHQWEANWGIYNCDCVRVPTM